MVTLLYAKDPLTVSYDTDAIKATNIAMQGERRYLFWIFSFVLMRLTQHFPTNHLGPVEGRGVFKRGREPYQNFAIFWHLTKMFNKNQPIVYWFSKIKFFIKSKLHVQVVFLFLTRISIFCRFTAISHWDYHKK